MSWTILKYIIFNIIGNQINNLPSTCKSKYSYIAKSVFFGSVIHIIKSLFKGNHDCIFLYDIHFGFIYVQFYICIYIYSKGYTSCHSVQITDTPWHLLRSDPSDSLYSQFKYCSYRLETKVSNNFFSFVLHNIDNTKQCDLTLFLLCFL